MLAPTPPRSVAPPRESDTVWRVWSCTPTPAAREAVDGDDSYSFDFETSNAEHEEESKAGESKNDDAGTPMLPALKRPQRNDVGRSPKLILSSHHRKSLKVEADDLHTSSVELLRDTYGVRTVVPVSARAQPTPPTTRQRRPSNRRFRRLSQGPPLSQPSSSVGLSPLTTPSTDAPSTVTPSGLVFVTSGDMSEQDAAGVVQTLLPLKSALEQGAAQLRCVADDVRMIGASAGETVDRLAVAFANTVQFAEDVAHAVTSLKYFRMDAVRNIELIRSSLEKHQASLAVVTGLHVEHKAVVAQQDRIASWRVVARNAEQALISAASTSSTPAKRRWDKQTSIIQAGAQRRPPYESPSSSPFAQRQAARRGRPRGVGVARATARLSHLGATPMTTSSLVTSSSATPAQQAAAAKVAAATQALRCSSALCDQVLAECRAVLVSTAPPGALIGTKGRDNACASPVASSRHHSQSSRWSPRQVEQEAPLSHHFDSESESGQLLRPIVEESSDLVVFAGRRDARLQPQLKPVISINAAGCARRLERVRAGVVQLQASVVILDRLASKLGNTADDDSEAWTDADSRMATRFANTINELLEGVGRVRLLLTADVGSRSGVGDRVLCRDGMLEVIDKCRARLSLALQSIEYLAHTKGAVFLRSAATSTHGLLDGMAVIVQRVTSMVNLSVDVAMVIEGAIELDSEKGMVQLQTVEQHVRRAVKRLLLDVDACTAGAAVTSADSFGVISAAVVAVADAVKRHVRLATLQRRLTATASMMEGADQAGAGPTGSRAGGDHDGDVTSVWRSMKSEVRRLTAVVSDERCQQDIVTLDDAVARVCDIAARTLRYSKARARLASVSDVAIALAAGADAGDVAAAVTSALSGCDGAAVFVARALLSAAAGGSCPSDAAMEHLDASVDALQQRVGAVSVAAKTWSSLRTVVDVMETLLPQAPRDNVIVRSMEAAVAAAVAMETPMVARMASAIAARATEPEDGGERQRFAAAVHSAVVSVCVAAAAVPLLAAEHDIAQRRTRVATTLTRLGLKQQLDTEAFETALVTVIMVAPPSPSSARTAAMSSARAVAAEVAAADTTAIASDKSRVLAAVPAGGLGPSVQAVVAEWSSVIAEEAARTTDVERWHDTAARLTTVVGKLKQAPQWLWANAMQRVVEAAASMSSKDNASIMSASTAAKEERFKKAEEAADDAQALLTTVTQVLPTAQRLDRIKTTCKSIPSSCFTQRLQCLVEDAERGCVAYVAERSTSAASPALAMVAGCDRALALVTTGKAFGIRFDSICDIVRQNTSEEDAELLAEVTDAITTCRTAIEKAFEDVANDVHCDVSKIAYGVAEKLDACDDKWREFKANKKELELRARRRKSSLEELRHGGRRVSSSSGRRSSDPNVSAAAAAARRQSVERAASPRPSSATARPASSTAASDAEASIQQLQRRCEHVRQLAATYNREDVAAQLTSIESLLACAASHVQRGDGVDGGSGGGGGDGASWQRELSFDDVWSDTLAGIAMQLDGMQSSVALGSTAHILADDAVQLAAVAVASTTTVATARSHEGRQHDDTAEEEEEEGEEDEYTADTA